jgi:hypothetical protein
MKRTQKAGTCRLRGRVIESLEVDGVHLLRLRITEGDIEVPSRTHDTAHLGDTLQVEGEISHAHLTVNPDTPPPHFSTAAGFRKSAE